MEFWHDVHDWLGGYPYESISPTRLDEIMTALGLQPECAYLHHGGYGGFGGSCNEYVYRRMSRAVS